MHSDYAPLHTLAKQVAGILGWKYNEDAQNWLALLSNAEASLGLEMTHKGKVVVTGFLPKGNYSRHDLHGPKISITASRGPEAIAKEIQRRLLPDYEAVMAEAMKRKADAEAYDNAARNNLERLADAFGTVVRDGDTTLHVGSVNDNYYGVATAGNTWARLELRSVPIDMAVRIGRILSGQEK